MSVTILSNEQTPLSANRKYDISCMTVGSRPAAELSWYMDGKKLTNHTDEVSLNVRLDWNLCPGANRLLSRKRERCQLEKWIFFNCPLLELLLQQCNLNIIHY